MKAVFYLAPEPDWAKQLCQAPWLMTIGGRPLLDHWFYASWELGVRQIIVGGAGCTAAVRTYLADTKSRWGVLTEFDPTSTLASLIRQSSRASIVFDDFNLPWLSAEDTMPPSRPSRPALFWEARNEALHASPVKKCNMISLASPIAYWEVNVALARQREAIVQRLPTTDYRLAKGAKVQDDAIWGSHCRIAHGAVVGEGTVLGDWVVVDEGARVTNSVILDGTYVGSNLDVCGRIVSGDLVLDPDTGAFVRFRESWMFAQIA